MPDRVQGVQSTTAGIERRAGMRVRAPALLYADMGNANGGIVTCINENGLAFTSAATLDRQGYEDELLRMRIHLPGHPGGIEAGGQIVWRSASGREAGIRFVDLSTDARRQIRSWISSQVSKDRLWADQRELPKMQLPATKPAKPHRARFSFADVASSRVGVEDESRSSDFFETDGDVAGPPSQSLRHGTFADLTEAVASAFESPVFAEEPKEKALATCQEQPPQRATEEQHQGTPPRSFSERRVSARRQILLFTYAVVDEDNGGLVFNLSEGGLALTAAAPLRDGPFEKIRLRFPDSEDWIEAKGRRAWISDSRKEGGIEFVGLPKDARSRIREWVSQGESAVFQPKEDEPRTSPYPEREAPSFIEQEKVPAARPNNLPPPFNEPAGPSPAALFTSGIKCVFARVSVRKPVAKINPPRGQELSVRPQRRMVQKALASAALFMLLVTGWFLFERGRSNMASGNRPQIVPNAPISSKSNQKNAVAETTTVADLPVQAIQNTPSPREITNSATPSTESGAVRGPREIVPSDKILGSNSLQDSPTANRAAHSRDSAKRRIAAARELNPKRQQSPSPLPPRPPESAALEKKSLASNVAESKPQEIKAFENKPVQMTEALPVQSKDLNAAQLAPNAPPVRPDAPPAAGLGKEKPSIAPKQPDAPPARTPLVTVSFDAFPSIRMPKVENPKKSRQGKSLQMGHLVLRVDPGYPEQAKQQGIEGTVKVHAIFTREGTVESLTPVSGPPLLVPAAMNAVRQWRYSQTILGGQAMGTEEDVTVVFQLSNGISRN